MAKNPKENKQLLELGSKARAGRLLSTYLRAIADEKTEVEDIAVSPDKVEHRIISKGEKIARDMFKIAMGNTAPQNATDVQLLLDPKLILEYRKLILERIDGKAGTVEGGGDDDHDPIPNRVSDINRQRMNRMAEEVMGEEDS